MKTIPFELERAKSLPNRIVTRDGRTVRILCTDRKHDVYPIVALVMHDKYEVFDSFMVDGRTFDNATNNPLDLFLLDVPAAELTNHELKSEMERLKPYVMSFETTPDQEVIEPLARYVFDIFGESVARVDDKLPQDHPARSIFNLLKLIIETINELKKEDTSEEDSTKEEPVKKSKFQTRLDEAIARSETHRTRSGSEAASEAEKATQSSSTGVDADEHPDFTHSDADRDGDL